MSTEKLPETWVSCPQCNGALVSCGECNNEGGMWAVKKALDTVASEMGDDFDGRMTRLSDAFARKLVAAHEAGWNDACEAAERRALEQRCERNTTWDDACVEVARQIRTLKKRGGG